MSTFKGKQKLTVVVLAFFASLAMSSSSFASVSNTRGDNWGTVELVRSGWLGGQGVDVYSNGATAEGPATDTYNYVNNKNGTSIQTGIEWQCVELINRLYIARGWITSTWHGNGGGTDGLYQNVPSGLTEEANGTVTHLSPGDVITLDGGSDGLGHAEIVDSVGSDGVVRTVSQNTTAVYTNATFSSGTITQNWTGYTVHGVIHSPNGSENVSPAQKAVPDDFNGDGKSDVALYYTSSSQGTPLLQILQSGGNGFSALSNTYGWGPPTKAVTGDFNGDGKTDLLWIEPYAGSYVGQVMLSTGAGFVSGWNNYGWGPPTWIGTGYFDSDNKADVALYYPNSSQGTPVLQVLKSTGSGFAALSNSYGWGPPGKAAVGDFNGDGLSDILWLEPYGGAYVAEVMESNGTGFVRGWNSYGWGLPAWLGVGDFDANGKSDVALAYSNVTMIEASSGSGFSNVWNTYGIGLPTRATVGFYNGDAKSDLLWMQPYGGAYVAQILSSNGVSGFGSAWNNFGWGLPYWMSGQ